MQEIKAPNEHHGIKGVRLFLAGSIEMGAAENWQDRLAKSLSDMDDLVILNPRRDDWDSSWEQTIENPQFFEQVAWELMALEASDVATIYFDPNTKSPITLLELGLFHQKAVVYCPEGFWRKGNVDIVCRMYDVRQAHTFDAFEAMVRESLETFRTREGV